MKKLICLLILVIMVSGCAALQIDPAIRRYKTEASNVQLGDTKDKVLSILLPTQEGLSGKTSKSPEAFMKENDIIEIYYFRSGRQPDGLTTDDEFTPYIFTNGILTGIGWTVLGGAKSHGQVIQPAPYTHVEQKTTIYDND